MLAALIAPALMICKIVGYILIVLFALLAIGYGIALTLLLISYIYDLREVGKHSKKK